MADTPHSFTTTTTLNAAHVDSPRRMLIKSHSVPHSTIPHLPPEIIHRIIELSLPLISLDTFSERYKILLNLSHVNSASWHASARALMLKHVYLRDDDAVDDLLTLVKKNPGLGGCVRTVRMSCDYDWESATEVLDLIRHFSRLQQFWTAARWTNDEYESGYMWMDLDKLQRYGQGWRVLALDYVYIHSLRGSGKLSSPFTLRHLETLAISDPENDETFEAILSGHYPALRHLYISSVDEGLRLGYYVTKALSKLAPRLLSFGLQGISSDADVATVWPELTNLQTLKLDCPVTLAYAVKHIPTPLVSVELLSTWDLDSLCRQAVKLALEKPHGISKLKLLKIGNNKSDRKSAEVAEAKAEEAFAALGAVCKRRKDRPKGYYPEWEDMVAGWD